MPSRRFFAVLDLVSAAGIAVGVFSGLPDRYWPVDACALVLVVLFAASGAGLLAGASWGRKVARITSVTSLGLGLVAIALLALSVSYLFGIYGAVGKGGGLLFTMVGLLLVPYLIVFPAAQLAWAKRAR